MLSHSSLKLQLFSNFLLDYYVPDHMLSLNKTERVTKILNKHEYLPMPHPVIKLSNRDDDPHAVAEQEAVLDQLGLRKLLFVGLVDTSRSPHFS